MYAHYFKRGTVHLLIVSETMQPWGERIEFKSKKECREYATKNGLTCWNF